MLMRPGGFEPPTNSLEGTPQVSVRCQGAPQAAIPPTSEGRNVSPRPRLATRIRHVMRTATHQRGQLNLMVRTCTLMRPGRLCGAVLPFPLSGA